ncbi:hypothetical protein [Salinibacter ruber]|uniref:Uncharacterized protein n=1 Tax=Salinibacter ruber TaxID=146919 RepID=A0A9X2QBA7_9BACT|nr:hypothetical protein [Salinibacter ruber]MCS3662055.1 hypothetical protein [Salinibacter ruber]MCS3711890.1 hypothetical protein [Salinibacter ruber]
MSTLRVIHIAPELPPTVGGVADYTAILSRRLVEVSDGAVEPVLVHAGYQETDAIEVTFPVVDLSGECSATALAETIERLDGHADGQAVVLLEYSGYGYAKRGAPRWLERGLSRVCGEVDIPLITVFHELYATGPPWSSAFWLSILQKHVVRQLARRSTATLTNRPDSASWLRKTTDNVHHRPIFSNVGELSSLPSWKRRNPRAVVFGGTGKEALYAKHGSELKTLLDAAGISELMDIGPRPDQKLLTPLDGIEVDVRGFVDHQEVSDHLQKSRLGLLCRNPEALTKSGSLMAYMSHGVPSFIAMRHGTQPNPHLEDGIHYLSLKEALKATKASDNDLSEIGRRGHDWYQSNAHSRDAAASVLRLIDAQ